MKPAPAVLSFLMNNTPANWFVIQSAQTLGTMVGFQTNNYYSLTDSGAACGGTPANPVPCTSAPYLSQLETGIFPLGKDYGLRSQYIELWAINANAFPQDILQAHSEIVATPIPADVVINLGAPQQLFHAGNPDAMGMTTVPDMHTTFIRQADSTYRVWITGHFYGDSVYGATGLITTRDFLKYKPVGNPTTAQVVLAPSCRPGSASCWNQYDADYAGADLVTWAPPEKFFSAPVKEFTVGQQTDENVVLVTPGFREQTIGQAGYVLYSHTPAWHNTPDELWMMPFAFNSPTTDVPGSGPPLPHVVDLLQNYPNPLNPSTTIRYELPFASHVSLTVFDVLGRQVRTLVNTFEQAGRHEATFNAQDVSSGTYFYRLEAGGSVETRKLTVLR
jgi:hypothetical protein